MLKNKRNLLGFFFLVFILLPINTTYAQDPKQSLINIGRITSWVSKEGFHDWVVENNTQWNGEYPIGKKIGVVFSEGLCWGGLVFDGQQQKVRVNGNTYGTGCTPISRLYRVRYDYSNGDLRSDASSFFNKDILLVSSDEIEQVRMQYQKDWNEWPASSLAPFQDMDKDGSYNPEIDIPGVPGSSQTIWINYSDSLSSSNYGSLPIGLDINETYWAYVSNTELGDVIFRKATIVYKGTSTTLPGSYIDSMYLCLWSDTDLGSSFDDFIGCDTLLNLGYVYNSNNFDQVYERIGMKPPAIGNVILDASSYYTGNQSDSAIINFKWKKGYRYYNLKPMSGAILHRTGDYFSDPSFNYNGTLEFYNLMRGYLPIPRYPASYLDGEFIGARTFMLPGDPINQTGLIDGIMDGAGDRRMMLMSGPFKMQLGDTIEIVTALVGGIGANNLSSVSHLKYNVGNAKLFYDFFVESLTKGVILTPSTNIQDTLIYPANYLFMQNYPNPFNSTTTFYFEQPKDAYVSLKIYNILGETVADVADEFMLAGKHRLTYNFNSLASGVYVAQIKFVNLDSNKATDLLTKSLKLVLLK